MNPEIRIDKARCTLCGSCIDACPVACFYEAEKEIGIVNEQLCLVCRNCEESCPSASVRVALGTL